ncbi:MAG: TIR domain-containing protein, partial [Chloroflexota bacterium]
MTRTDISQETVNEIVSILTPLLPDVPTRQAFVNFALYDAPQLRHQVSLEGAPHEFTVRLLSICDQFGNMDDGTPAVWLLLNTARGQVGLEKKHQIDALRVRFNIPLPVRKDRLFVSYSRRNEQDAQRLVGDLKDAGLRVWFDREKIKGGEDWWQSIESGIIAADFFIFCLSPDSIRSEVARKELVTARNHRIPIFPVMLVDCMDKLRTGDFAEIAWLPDLHIINFTLPDDYGIRLRELVDSLPGYALPDPYYFEAIDSSELTNPFRGLEAFYYTDVHYFHGREDAIQTLQARLNDPTRPRLLAVVGASGSGKSSLVRAGLIPALKETHSRWQTLIIRPENKPINNLADRLQERLGVEAEGTRTRLRSDVRALDDIAAELLAGRGDDARFVLVFDQFEELFTQTNLQARQQMLDLLLYAVKIPEGQVWVVLTMRADFFDRLSEVPDMAELVDKNVYIATQMKPEQIRKTIEKPAEQVGVHYEPELVERILEDVRDQPGSLPLLQYALRELFEHRIGRKLTKEAYDRIGGVKGALASRADEVYQDLSSSEKRVLRHVMLRLVDVGDKTVTRRRASETELAFSNVEARTVKNVLNHLTDEKVRLLVASVPLDPDAPTYDDDVIYEVSHEALLTHWKTLNDWITDNRDDLYQSSELE